MLLWIPLDPWRDENPFGPNEPPKEPAKPEKSGNLR